MKHTKPAISKSRLKSKAIPKKKERNVNDVFRSKKTLKETNKEKAKHTKPAISKSS